LFVSTAAQVLGALLVCHHTVGGLALSADAGLSLCISRQGFGPGCVVWAQPNLLCAGVGYTVLPGLGYDVFSDQGCWDTCGAAPHTQGAREATWRSCLPYLAGSPFHSPTLRQYTRGELHTRGELQTAVLCLDSARVAGSTGPVSACLRTLCLLRKLW